MNNPARTGGIRTPEACQRTKKQHLIQKTTSSSTFWCIWPPPVFDTKHASQTGNFAYPHLTAMDFPIRLQPFMS
ncbi:hypothetical protein HMPREF9536_05637 [Escherichia coli MS 84-1]|nr:hypothetical protein HMPREF9536_05637 [Escherichia coli MS 84-1]